MNKTDLTKKMVRILSDRDPYGWRDSFLDEVDAFTQILNWIEDDPISIIDQLLDFIEEDNE